MTTVEDVADIINSAIQKEKPLRTKKTEKPKKVAKLTKKEQQILDIEASIVMPDNYTLINTPELLERLVNYYKAYKTMYQGDAFVYLDTETYGLNNWKDALISISIGFASEQYFNIPMRPFLHEMSKDVETLSFDVVADALRPLLEADKMLVLANAKFDVHVLYNWANIDITFNIVWDTMLAGGLLNENKPKGLKEWYNNYALPWLIQQGKLPADEITRPTFKFGSLFDKIPFDSIPHRLANYYACHDVFMTHWVFEYQRQIFSNPVFGLGEVYNLFRTVEMPLLAVFAVAERRGVALDSKFLKGVIGEVLQGKSHELLHGYTKKGKDGQPDEYVQGIYDYIGNEIQITRSRTRQRQGVKYKEEFQVVEPLNLGSPSQLAQKLYEEYKILEPEEAYDHKLKQKVMKKSTSKKVLTRNKRKHKVIELILEWRGLSKLIDAFCNKLPDDAVDGIIHCSYNQLVRTGRVSCSNPNLQQIPSRFDLIRYAFRAAGTGRVLAGADFSQQELRWLAILTKEPSLIDVFKHGLDMHSKITCQIHGLDYDMFEQIRNYKAETAEETSNNTLKAIADWEGTPSLQYAVAYYNTKEKTRIEEGVVNEATILSLASFFESSRKKAKSVSFGVVYGITAIGLADQIESTKEEAQSLIDGFKAGLPNYLLWEAATHREIMEKGFIETALGRKRRFSETIAEAKKEDSFKRSGWHWKIEGCKRQSCNAKIQGKLHCCLV